jgi:predicted ATPase with chaperone activity
VKAIVDTGAKKLLSTRGIVRLRRLARTCADLRSSGSVEAEDVEKAIGFMTVPLPNMDRLT